MEQHNITPGMIPPKKSSGGGMKIVGYNLLAFAVYCGLSALIAGNIFSALPVFILHIIACLILAIVQKKAAWALAAGLLLVVGFSTCVASLAGM